MSFLSKLLAQLLKSARADQGSEIVSQPLKGGLVLAVSVTASDVFTVRLARLGQKPGWNELKTVLDHWPEPWNPREQAEYATQESKVSDWHSLSAMWRLTPVT